MRESPSLAAAALLGLSLFLSCAGSHPPPAPRAAEPPAPASAPAPSPEPGDEAAIRDAVALRERSIAAGDKALFMSLLAPRESEFLLEQSRWFDYRLSAAIEDFRLEASSILPRGPGDCEVSLRMSYRIGPGRELREVRYAERYIRAGGTWLDADLALDSLESAHFELRFQPGVDRTRAARISAQAEAAWEIVRSSYGEAPAGRTTLKVFADRELLRQNTKITIGRPFSGWAEPGESIKMWLRPDPTYSYSPVLAHELVHKVTLETSKNLCSWLAEGTANCFGSFPAMGGSYLGSGFHKKSDYDRSLAWLASIDPEAVSSDAAWWIYGGMSGAAVQFIAERWGAGVPRALVHALADYPQVEGGYVYALHDAAFRGYLAEALRSVLGIGMDELDAAWLSWIEAYGGS